MVIHAAGLGTYEVVAAGDHGLVGLRDAFDRRVALGVSTKPEIAAGSIKRQQMDGGT